MRISDMRLRLPMLAAAVLLMATACSGSTSTPTTAASATAAGSIAPTAVPTQKSFSGVTVKFLRHSGYDAGLMEEALKAFTASTGIKVQIDLVPFAQLNAKEVVELSGGSSSYDLMASTDYWLTQFAGGGWLQPMSSWVNDPTLAWAGYNFSDIPQSIRDDETVNGELVALPWKFNTTMLYYRKDLLSAPPASWDDWTAAAKQATSGTTYGIGLSLDPANFCELYMNLVYTAGGTMLTADNKAAGFNSAAGLKALTFLKTMMTYAPAGALSRQWAQNSALMAQGITITDVLIPGETATVEKAGSKSVGNIGYVPMPPATTGGKAAMNVNTWGLIIPKTAQNREAAFLVAQYLTSPEVVKSMTISGTGTIVGARTSVLSDTSITSKYPSLKAALDTASNGSAWFFPRVTQLAAIQNAVATRLGKTLSTGEDLQTGLTAAAADVTALLK